MSAEIVNIFEETSIFIAEDGELQIYGFSDEPCPDDYYCVSAPCQVVLIPCNRFHSTPNISPPPPNPFKERRDLQQRGGRGDVHLRRWVHGQVL